MSQCPDVGRVVVLRHQLSDVSDVLVAYYTLVETSATDTRRSARRLKSACVTSLPVYMRPKLVLVDKLPLQSYSGKVDREALHQIYVERLNRQSCSQLATLNELKKKVEILHRSLAVYYFTMSSNCQAVYKAVVGMSCVSAIYDGLRQIDNSLKSPWS